MLSADKPCVNLDLAGCALPELVRMTPILFDPKHGLNVQVDLSNEINRSDEALKENAALGREYKDEEGLPICKTYVLQAAVFFVRLSDLFHPPSPGHGDGAHPLMGLRAKEAVRQLCDFWLDVQRTCGTGPILVVTKVDHYFPEYRNVVGLLPANDGLAGRITNKVRALINAYVTENGQDIRHVSVSY
jgi:hypothetical protein